MNDEPSTNNRFIHPYLLNNEFTLDDLIFPATKIPRFEPSEVDYSTKLTKRITLQSPIIGSPMDTVTGADMAILLGKMGGIGVIHSGFTIDQQIAEVEKVRRWEAGFVRNPKVLKPTATVKDVLIGEEIFGFSSYPVTKDGTLNSPIIGIVTGKDVRDYREAENHNIPLKKIMTPLSKLIFAKSAETLDINNIRAANSILRQHSLDTLPILDKKMHIVALVTRSDIEKDDRFPKATKDGNKQLKVLAAVESRFSNAKERIEALVISGVSGIVIDSRNIYGDYVKIAKFAKKLNPEIDVIIGNIVHPDVLKEVLAEAGEFIDAFRVGIGTGEVCVTSEDLGIGRGMGSALLSLDAAYQEMGGDNKFGYIGFMPDGGIKFPKHFLAGASVIKNFSGVMMGSVLAGFDESPADKRQKNAGVYVKRVRGMGSLAAIMDRAGGSRYGVDKVDPTKRYAEGIEKEVPAIGPGQPFIEKYFEGIRTAMHGLGAKNLEELYNNAQLYPISKAASKGSL